jgi:Fe-S-cluster containining protein
MGSCNGQCCRRFFLPISPEELKAEAAKEKSHYQEVKFIADMVIFLGTSELDVNGDPLADRPFFPRNDEGKAIGHYYTCKHHDSNTGLCTIYDRRPEMCRRYPYGRKCEYRGCEFDGPETRPDPELLAKLDAIKQEPEPKDWEKEAIEGKREVKIL